MQTDQTQNSGKITVHKYPQALNKAFLKIKHFRSQVGGFKQHLIHLLDRTNDTEPEEFHENMVIDFLKKTWFAPEHFINTKGRNDLVIRTADSSKN